VRLGTVDRLELAQWGNPVQQTPCAGPRSPRHEAIAMIGTLCDDNEFDISLLIGS
jgi:hypothetical protein